jgi:hypothetical protein
MSRMENPGPAVRVDGMANSTVKAAGIKSQFVHRIPPTTKPDEPMPEVVSDGDDS